MTLRDVATIVRRRLWIVVLVTAIGASAGLLVGDTSESDEATFRSDATLTLAPSEDSRAVELYTYIASETVEIERDVETSLGEPIRGEVVVEPVPGIGAIRLSASGQPDEATAQEVLDLYAQVMGDYVVTRRIVERDTRLETLAMREAELTEQVEALAAELRRLQALQPPELAGQTVDPVIETSLAAASEALGEVLKEQDELRSENIDVLSPFDPLGATQVEPEPSDSDPLGRTGRVVLGVVLGLVLGVALAIGLHRFDTRLFSRHEAETAYSLPVLAEVAPTPWRMRRNDQIVSRDHPAHPSTEAYRILRSSISRARSAQLAGVDESQRRPGTVLVVTSASAAVGKSTSVANLAAVAADAGNTVLVVSADLRHPAIHGFFGVDPEAPGLSEAGIAQRVGRDRTFDDYIVATNEPNVSFLPHGTVALNPGDVIADALPLLDDVRDRFDLVIVDTPPMLAGNDVDELLPAADLVIQIARAGRTTYDEGAWTDEMINRRQTPTVGLVLIGVSSDLARRSAARRRPTMWSKFRQILNAPIFGPRYRVPSVDETGPADDEHRGRRGSDDRHATISQNGSTDDDADDDEENGDVEDVDEAIASNGSSASSQTPRSAGRAHRR